MITYKPEVLQDFKMMPHVAAMKGLSKLPEREPLGTSQEYHMESEKQSLVTIAQCHQQH